MGKKVLKSLITTMGVGIALLAAGIPAFAAGTVSVSADKSATNVSDRVTVTVQTSDPEDAATPPQISITYDTEMLNFESCNVEYGGGGGGLITVTGTSAEIQFTTLKEGNASVNAEAIIDEDGNNPATGAAAITVGAGEAAPAEGGQSGASDAALRALVVDKGTMVPSFSPEVTQYTIYADESVTDIKISGGVRNENATITAASGFKNLQPGNNQALITVTAEDGTSLTYNFTIQVGGEMPVVDEAAPAEDTSAENEAQASEETKAEDAEEADDEDEGETSGAAAEAGSMELVVDGNTYTIYEKVDTLVLPAGCSKSSMDYFGTNIETVVFEAGNLTMVYAVSLSDGSGEFFIYDEKKKTFTLFAEIKGSNNKYIIPVPAKEKLPSGFSEDNMSWNSCSLPAYSLTKKTAENADEFYLLYAINQDGKEGFYLYDSEEENYQRFLNYAGKVSSSKGGGSVMLIGALLIVIVGLIILVVNFIIKNRELAGDLEILAQARERRKSEPVKKTNAAPKKVIVPTEDGEGNPVVPAEPKKKEEPKKNIVQKRVLNPGEDDELGLADKANMRTDLPVQTREEEAPVQEVDSTSVKTVKPEVKDSRDTEKKAEKVGETKTSEETFTSQIVGATDDLSDVADLLNNEENEQFMKTFKSFSTGRINVAYPQNAPTGRSITKPASLKSTQSDKEKTIKEEMPIQVKEVEAVEEVVKETVTEEIVERKSVSLTREALPDEPDDDFELEFINLDEN